MFPDGRTADDDYRGLVDFNRGLDAQEEPGLLSRLFATGRLIGRGMGEVNDVVSSPRLSDLDAAQHEIALMMDPREGIDQSIRSAQDGDYVSALAEGAMSLPLIASVTKPAKAAKVGAKLAGKGDLPMDEASRMARAREMGFDERDFYHGTRANFEFFDPAKAGSATAARDADGAVFMTDNPSVSDGYARMAKMPDDMRETMRTLHAEREKLGDAIWSARGEERAPIFARMQEIDDTLAELTRNERAIGQQVYPLRARGDFAEVPFSQYDGDTFKAAMDAARAEGRDGVRFIGGVDASLGQQNPQASEILAVFDPSNIRSKFAKFDPAKRGSSDILASMAPIGLGTVGALPLLTSRDD
jgi:hypothetical protein